MTEFNLVSEPWIPIRRDDGTTSMLSLAETFASAGQIRELCCELPIIDMAVLRILVAVTRRAATTWYDEQYDGDDLYPAQLWKILWDDEEALEHITGPYLDRWENRFDLLDDTNPFMQAPRMEATNGTTKGVRAIILDFLDSNRGSQFWQRTAESAETLAYDEAARWLIACHAWDVAGIKSGMKGDPRVKGGKCSPQGTGWCGAIGGIYAKGANLRETILLNTSLCASMGDIEELPDESDLPAWERPTETARDANRMPDGPSDMLTWQSRRVWLLNSDDGQHIDRVLLTNGDRVSFVNQYDNEPMTAWRRNATVEKSRKSPTPIYTPIGHMPSKALWRGLSALLPQVQTEDGAASFKEPGVLQWLGVLAGRNYRILPQSYPVSLHATGISYGTNNAVVSEMIDDELSIVPMLLCEEGEQARSVVRECIETTEDGVYVLARLGSSLMATINGRSDDPSSKGFADELREQAYATLNRPFVSWLASIRADTDLEQARRRWLREAYDAIRRIGQEAVRTMPPASFVGRECSLGKGKQSYETAGSVESLFRWKLSETFGAARIEGNAPTPEDSREENQYESI